MKNNLDIWGAKVNKKNEKRENAKIYLSIYERQGKCFSHAIRVDPQKGFSNPCFFVFSDEKCRKKFGVSKNISTFAPAFQRKLNCNKVFGYGVMVTLQILVLSFLVRVRVPQLFKTLSY